MVEKGSFTQNYSIMILACVIALVLAGYMIYRVDAQKKSFDGAVRSALQTSEGYDRAFIDMVNRLEDELATRASFGYAGRKDPMTGTVRSVVVPAARQRRAPAASTAAAAAGVNEETAAAAEAVDPVRLTAIIFDNTRNIYTAVVMDGERSFSVDEGDRVAGRRITRITGHEIMMENDMERFTYNISGDKTVVQK